MNNVVLKRIYLENYKIFDRQTLILDTCLSVLDGPNGYGKTSIFDAIEFIITGNINRIQNSDSISGSVKYNEIFLAKDSAKDVVIKAEFSFWKDEQKEPVVLAKRIPAVNNGKTEGGLNRNPKKLSENTQSYHLPDFDTPVQSWDKYLISPDKLPNVQAELFGSRSQELYQLLYYIQQEDRLSFFKNPEKARVERINTLFNIKNDLQKADTIKQARKTLKSIIDELDKQITQLTKDLDERTTLDVIGITEYKQLLTKDVMWDQKQPPLNSPDAYSLMLNDVLCIQSLIHNLDWYDKDQKNKECFTVLQLTPQVQQTRLFSFLLYQTIGTEPQGYKERQKNFNFLNDQKALADQQRFFEIDYKMLLHLLSLEEKDEYFLNLVLRYQQNQKSASTMQQALTSVLTLRQQLTDQLLVLNDSEQLTVCHYCGYDWKDAQKLSQQISLTTDELKKLSEGTATDCIQIAEKIRKSFIEQCQETLEKELQKYLDDYLLMSYCKYDNPKALMQARSLSNLFARLKIDMSNYKYIEEPQQNLVSTTTLMQKLEDAITVLPEEYIVAKAQFNFEQAFLRTFKTIDEARKIKIEDIEQKINYLQYIFQNQQGKKQEQLKALRQKKELLEKQVALKLDLYEKCQKNGIIEYKAQIITKIEIPFYIYSARILQSYQGGQGIIIKHNSSDSIRFVSPGREHDVLYTMSSGQLSAVLLSFSLALNKIFASDGLKTIFIDDPVQCMDDLNMISFVEVLRNEFSNSQIVISTHENSFANYINYKYQKHRLTSRAINLKSIGE